MATAAAAALRVTALAACFLSAFAIFGCETNFAFAVEKSEGPAVTAPAAPSEVKVLTDATFEVETQAASGHTSGSWFVKFYAPWCGHCRRMAPAWETLAKELAGSVNVAELDATTNPNSASRFGIRGFPTLLFFKDGKMYDYKGDRSVEKMKAFATGGWEDAVAKEVPPPLSFFAICKDKIVTTLQHLRELFLVAPAPMLLLLFMGIICGCLVSWIFFALCCDKPATVEKVSTTRSSKKKD